MSRSGWGARPPSGAGNTISAHPLGHAIHWEGPHMGPRSHSECDDTVRGIQAYHMDHNGWSDIAYNILVCVHGYCYEGRGKGKGSAANGTTQANADYYAICALVGEGDPQPTELVQGLKDAADTCRAWGAGGASTGHRDHYSTECPGDALYSLVKAGRFTTTGDDDDVSASEVWKTDGLIEAPDRVSDDWWAAATYVHNIGEWVLVCRDYLQAQQKQLDSMEAKLAELEGLLS